MGDKKLVLGKEFNLEKIEEKNHQEIIKRLLGVTRDFRINGTILIFKDELRFADELDKKTNPVGGNTLAILAQTIEAIKVAFGDKDILRDKKISLTMADGKFINFHAQK